MCLFEIGFLQGELTLGQTLAINILNRFIIIVKKDWYKYLLRVFRERRQWNG